MQNILVAVDGSPYSRTAVDIAATLAKADNAQVTVVHVISGHAPSSQEREMIEVEYADELVEKVSWPKIEPGNSVAYARTVFDTQAQNNQSINSIIGRIISDQALKRLHDADVQNVKSVNKHGHAADEILNAASDHDCDVIVMGTRGMSDVQGLFAGSVSHKVAHSAECNVILVK